VDRSAIFVDAGYLLAAGGKLTCGTTSRSAFKCDYVGLTAKLAGWVEDHNHGRLNRLRTYWYDGAVNAVPTGDHEQIGGLPYVKVRLGRLIRGEQKGVDALIYRDLMTLARERAITCAYLLSGDEDHGKASSRRRIWGYKSFSWGFPQVAPISRRPSSERLMSTWFCQRATGTSTFLSRHQGKTLPAT
jgi:hypothetical protein